MNKYEKLKKQSEEFEEKKDFLFNQLGVMSVDTNLEFGEGHNGRSKYTTTIISHMPIDHVLYDLFFALEEAKEKLKSFESTRLVLTEKNKKK